MSDAGVSWAWYAGGWDNAAGNIGGPGWTNGFGPACTDPNVSTADGKVWPFCPDSSFQFHHQPFNYFLRYAPGTVDRAVHLKDEVAFLDAAKGGHLPQVSFVKPLGNDAEDAALCDAALRCGHLASIGLIGSSAKWRRFEKKLAAEGHGPEQLARITTPIGLPEITGKDPATIAVGVAADLVLRFERAATDNRAEQAV